jgi:hypothetical protein
MNLKLCDIWETMGSPKASGKEPKIGLGRVFHFKEGSFAELKDVHDANTRPFLKLKAWPRFFPASLSFLHGNNQQKE